MIWLAAKDATSSAWTWLRGVPAWVYAVLGWAVAVLFWNLSRTWKNRAEVQAKQAEARTKLQTDFQRIAQRKEERSVKAVKEHAATEAVLDEKERELDKKTDVADVADAINESFKEKD